MDPSRTTRRSRYAERMRAGDGGTGPKGGETTRTPGGLQRVAVLLTEEQYRELRRLAYERGESQSTIIRDAFDLYLAQLSRRR